MQFPAAVAHVRELGGHELEALRSCLVFGQRQGIDRSQSIQVCAQHSLVSDGRDSIGQRRRRCGKCRCGVCGELRSQRLDEGVPLGASFGIGDIQCCELRAQSLVARRSSVPLAPERIEALRQLAHQLRAGLVA